MKRPVHFEILADHPEQAAAFYRDVFDWRVATWTGGEQSYWLVTTGADDLPGINGGIMGRRFDQAVINTVEVESLAKMIQKAEAAGGRVVHGPNEAAGVGQVAYCADPDGNLFGMMQPASE